MRFIGVLAVTFLLAGCTANAPQPTPSEPASDAAHAQLLAQLAAMPTPAYQATAGVDWWEGFVNGNSLRQYPLPTNAAAGRYLRDELKEAGFQAVILDFPAGGGDPAVDPPVLTGLQVVQGLREGATEKDQRLVITSHFDTVFTTQQGAYDDGSGVAAALHICLALAKVPLNKTLECLFFNSEEDGGLASKAYTDWYTANKPSFTWAQGFGYDMTGLNWPGYKAWKLYAFLGMPRGLTTTNADAHHRFLETVAFDFLGPRMNTSEEGFEVLDVNDRNSDERNFQNAGVPVVRFAGGRKAGDYPQYHKADDTVEFVYKFACGGCNDRAQGKTAFAAGLEAVVVVSTYAIMAYDAYDARTLEF